MPYYNCYKCECSVHINVKDIQKFNEDYNKDPEKYVCLDCFKKEGLLDYFKTESDKYVFALLECNGSMRKDMLGITKMFYNNLAYKTKIINEIKEKIKGHPKEFQALKVLEDVFEKE